MLFKALVITAILSVCVAMKSYEGYKVIELNLKDEREVKLILRLTEEYLADVWKGPSFHTSTHIMLSPSTFKPFTAKLTSSGIKYKVIIENVQETLEKK